MLYIFHLIVLVIWVGLLITRKKITWNAVINIYAITLLVVDIIEIVFNQILGWYKFPTHIFKDPIRDNFFGILMGDSFILPLTAIIFCYYVRDHQWKTAFIFTFIMFVLEWIYLQTDYLRYYHWNIAYSALFYFAGFRFFALVGQRFIYSQSSIPYFIRILCFAYVVIVLPGAFPDVLFNLHYWRPGFVEEIPSDDRIADLGSGFIIAFITGLVIPKTPIKYRFYVFIALMILTISFGLFSHWKGWLIYNYWNNYLTILRYAIPFFILIWYDRWQRQNLTFR